MRRILRYAIVVGALCAAAAYYLKEPAGAMAERAPALADEWGEGIRVKGQSVSSAKRRLDLVRERTGSSMEASRARVAKHL